MERGENLARSALRWDGAYCIVMGAALAVFFKPVAGVLDAPRPLVAIGGLAAIAWGVGLLIAEGPRWRPITATVSLVNLVVAAVLVVISLASDIDTAGRVPLIGVAIQVAGFAATQAHAVWSPFRR